MSIQAALGRTALLCEMTRAPCRVGCVVSGPHPAHGWQRFVHTPSLDFGIKWFIAYAQGKFLSKLRDRFDESCAVPVMYSLNPWVTRGGWLMVFEDATAGRMAAAGVHTIAQRLFPLCSVHKPAVYLPLQTGAPQTNTAASTSRCNVRVTADAAPAHPGSAGFAPCCARQALPLRAWSVRLKVRNVPLPRRTIKRRTIKKGWQRPSLSH